MAAERFKVTKDNPNAHGGCLCSPENRAEGCEGPFAVFYIQEMASNRNPHAVVCVKCLEGAYSSAVNFEEEVIDATAVEPVDDDGEPDSEAA